jgi:hypothetical protein
LGLEWELSWGVEESGIESKIVSVLGVRSPSKDIGGFGFNVLNPLGRKKFRED